MNHSRFFKFVEQHSHHSSLSGRYPFNKMDSLYSLWSNTDWSKPRRTLLKRFMSHEKLYHSDDDSTGDLCTLRRKAIKTMIDGAETSSKDSELEPMKLGDEFDKYQVVAEQEHAGGRFRRIATTGRFLVQEDRQTDSVRVMGQYATL